MFDGFRPDLNWNGGLVVNPVSNERIHENARANLARGLPLFQMVREHDWTAVFVGGGPSLASHLEELRERARDPNVKIFTSGSTLRYLVDNGIVPWGFLHVDPKPSTARYLENAPAGTRYFVAAHSDPSVFDALAGRHVWLCVAPCGAKESDVGLYDDIGEIFPILGGITTPLRMFSVAWYLGFRTLEFYGLDSCFDDESRQYAYDKNVHDDFITVKTDDGRSFLTCRLLAMQAHQFDRTLRIFGDKMKVGVHGDGLIAHMMTLPDDLDPGDKKFYAGAGNILAGDDSDILFGEDHDHCNL